MVVRLGFIFVDDICAALLRCCELEGLESRLYHLATGTETSINELIAILQQESIGLGLRMPPVHFGSELRGDVSYNFSIYDRAKSELG